MDEGSSLHALARAHGVRTSYNDISGKRRDASPEALVEVLRALGVAIEGPADADLWFHRTEAETWAQVLEPAIVAWDGQGRFQVRLPEVHAESRYEIAIELEQGGTVETSGDLSSAPIEESVTVRGERFVVRGLVLPPDLPAGYHTLNLHLGGPGGGAYSSLVLSAPRRVHQPEEANARRYWGVFLPLYALHRAESRGAGNLTDLRALIDWTAERGGDIVGTLPLLSSFLDEPYDPSPYSPVSRLFWNELYLDVGALEGASQLAPAATRTAACSSVLVDYKAEMAAQRPRIQTLADHLFTSSGPEREAFERYLSAHPDLATYARFRAVVDRTRAGWPAWPERLREGNILPGDYDEAHYRYHTFAQWSLHRQLEDLSIRARSKGLGLYLDLPVGVNGGGYDTWREREVFVNGCAAGAPPDVFFTGGQNWGFPPLHPERIREQSYRYVIAMLRNHFRYAGVLRVDHVMGLHRIFFIPQGMPASEGVYVAYRPDELYAILSIESHRSRTLLVGEDLGTVPPAVRDAMNEHDVLGMHVLQFAVEAEPKHPIRPPAARTLASINTHDTPTFSAFWNGLDIEERKARGWVDEREAREERGQRAAFRDAIKKYFRRRASGNAPLEEQDILRACVEELGYSEALAVLVSLEDLWLEPEPQNVPGTGVDTPNWRRRAKYTLEQIQRLPGVDSALNALAKARSSTRPIPQVPDEGLTEFDLHLFNEGTHTRLHDKLGAHSCVRDGVSGTRFAVWAPNASRVAVMGSFNGWNRESHPLIARGRSGIWEGFVPGADRGDLYKYHVVSRFDGRGLEKADPIAFSHEVPPRTASIISDLDYAWGDAEWMNTRATRNRGDAPISIYEVHLGSWRRRVEENDRPLTYREIAPLLADHVLDSGFTHVELMPVMEHPFYGSWGYQVTGFFAPTRRYGTPQDFMYLVDYLHRAGIGVILDWVPSHFPGDAHGLAVFDGTCVYEHIDPRQGFHPEWKSFIFNYGRHEVRSFLISSALFWLDRYHVDGLRVDAVASMLYLDYARPEGEWVPNAYGGRENLEATTFIRQLNECVLRAHPDVQMIAEESTAWTGVSRPAESGGLGFTMKWDMGWMHDTLRYFGRDPIHRKWHQGDLTFRGLYAHSERFVLSLSHDEVVHLKRSLLDKMPGDVWQKRANLRLLYGYMWAVPGKKHLFMGQEIGQWREWNHDQSLDWHLLHDPAHAGILRWVADLNAAYRRERALHEADFDPLGFEWIAHEDHENSVLAFLRRGQKGDDLVIAIFNFTPIPRYHYRVGVPRGGRWIELLNGDAAAYGGAGIGNAGWVDADEIGAHGRACSVSLTLPPLAALYLKSPGKGS